MLTLARLGGKGTWPVVISTASSQMYLRLQVCMGDVQQDGLNPVFPVWSVPKSSSPDDDVHPQIPVCSDRFAALYLVWNSEPLQRAGDREEKWLVLVHLRPDSGTDACVPGVHVDCIAAGAQNCYVLLDPCEAPFHAPDLCCRYDTEQVCWPRPKACSGSCPLQAPIASLGEGLGLASRQWVARSRRACAVSGSCSSEAG